jgi:hypothetical protein
VTLPVWTRVHLGGWCGVAGGGLLAVFNIVPQVAAAIAAIGFGAVVVSVTIVRDAERGARPERRNRHQTDEVVEAGVVDAEVVEHDRRQLPAQEGSQ